MMMMIFKSKFIYFIFFSLSSLIFVFKWQKNVYFFFSTILDDDDDGNFLWLIWIEFPSEDDDKDWMIRKENLYFFWDFFMYGCVCMCVAYFLRLNVSISFIKFFPIFFHFFFTQIVLQKKIQFNKLFRILSFILFFIRIVLNWTQK